ncbi:MAG: MopE-related protein, partial [Myxococcota bacterium]
MRFLALAVAIGCTVAVGCSVDHAGLAVQGDGGVVQPDEGVVTCVDGTTQPCGDTVVMGVCRPGTQRCVEGRWSECEGEVLPSTEVCDDGGLDEDCDGTANEGCACSAGQRCGPSAEVGECRFGTALCTPEGTLASCEGAVSPALDMCDGLDNDCDGTADNDESFFITFFRDQDGDGAGDEDVSMRACDPPDGFVRNTRDCDDDDRANFETNAEVCDRQDNDCDGRTDEGLNGRVFYFDDDDDGFGDPGAPQYFCGAPPAGYVRNNDDCNDTTRDARPGGVEVCDLLDNDCDWDIDERACFQNANCSVVRAASRNYVICDIRRTYQQAIGTCSGGAGAGLYRLAIVESFAEHEFITNATNAIDDGDIWWIGLDDRDSEGTFVWFDGTPLGSYQPWDISNPADPEPNLKLRGMSCAYCANSIELAISNVPGVAECN